MPRFDDDNESWRAGHLGGERDLGPGGSRGLPRGFWGRLLENPENPLGWSLKLFRIAGVTVRIHLLTVVYMLGQLLWSIPTSHGGIAFVAPAMLALFVIVLAHEFGHCFASRYAGGAADRIVMLPWGGLALTQPREDWRAHFITTAGGPLTNVALLPVFALLLWVTGEGDKVLFDPRSPLAAIAGIAGSSSVVTVLKVQLWWLHCCNIYVLAFNLLLPMYPFDGGRLVQALLWSRMGRRRSMEISTLVGLGGAMVLAVAALLVEKALLVLIAVFGAWACWMEMRRARGEADLVTGEVPVIPISDEVEPPPPAPSRRELKQAEQERRSQAELDRLLAKIAASGMDSLSRAERKWLDQESRRKSGK